MIAAARPGGAPGAGRDPRPLLAAALLLSGCGYAFSAQAGRMPAGAERIHVPPFENRTTDAEVGALVASALRQELARRGALGDAGAPARIEGVALSVSFAPSSFGSATSHLALVVSAKLVAAGRTLAEQRVQRDEDYLGAVDALENEGRRRVALRRAAEAAARDIMERFELP